ncbi:receptor-type tyrosine-protein phosphatase mu-like [Ptychodera flava]|uniref:receptor-type tyrosine-protein phosphatase mu-like n=1 Tax=Ptychodera flava TaxID=63121 RepID=UPI00396A6509
MTDSQIMVGLLNIVPGLPGTIGVSEVHENKISVFWTEPVVYSGDIQQYWVMYYPMESIFRHELFRARSVLLEGNRVTYTLDDLMPGTTYGIQVNASTSKGFGKPRTVKARTLFADDILKQLPLADMVKHNVEHSDTRTTVKLPGLSYDTRISKETTLIDYIIIVAYGENSAEEKLRKIDFERLGRYRTSGLTYYITASLLLKDLPSSFVVGDGRVYGGFNNVPLLPGKKYHIFYGLGSNITGDYEYYFSADTSVSFTGHHESTSQPSSTRIILIIVLIIILLIGILLLFICT